MITASRAGWIGRALLLAAVAFWWGAVVAPQLFNLAFPDVLPWSALPSQLNPDAEGSLANAVVGCTFVTAAILATRAARQAASWRARGGWVMLAVVLTIVGWEELADFRGGHLAPNAVLNVAVTGLVIATVVVSFGLLISQIPRHSRLLLAFSMTAWLLTAGADEGGYRFAAGNWYAISVLLEETLEFCGALLCALAALPTGPPRRIPYRRLAWIAGVVTIVIGGLIALERVSTWRETLVDTRGRAVIEMGLPDGYSLAQELGEISAPLNRIAIRATGALEWRVREGGLGGPILREGRVEIAPAQPVATRIDFPVLLPNSFTVQFVADGNARLLTTQTDTFPDLRFSVQGGATWPDQKLEVVAYGPRELTRVKLAALWRAFEWSWMSYAVATLIGLVSITFVPILLITAALPLRGKRT